MPATTADPQEIKPAHLEIPRAVRAILRPPEDLRVSEWVERYRRLHDRDAAEPGPFSFEKIPYMLEPTDAFADPGVRSIVLIKASRCSGTELINNIAAYSIDARPMPCIYVLPRADDVEEEFKGRLKRLIEASTKLAAHIPGGNWATEEAITLDTMTVMAAAATAAGDFIRRTSGLNLFDEVDNCAAFAGRLGDIWTLLEDRLTTYGYRGKQVGVSTPTVTEGAGWKAWLKSDQRRYWCPCPRCGHYQILQFDQLKLAPGHEDQRDPERIEFEQLARYLCENPACGALLPESEKLWMTARGLWVPACQKVTTPLDIASKELVERAHFRAGAQRYVPPLTGEKPIGWRRGYWCDATVSPWRTFSAFLAKFFATKDDPPQYRVFWNGWRALPWQEAAQSTDAADLRPKVELGHPPEVIPDRAVVLLGYADVQASWLYYNLWAFGPGEEAWLIRHGTAADFEEFESIALGTQYPYADGKGSLACRFIGYDSGYRTARVYERWIARPAEVIVTKGQELLSSGEVWKPSNVEYYPSGKRNPVGVKLYHLNTAFFKEKVNGLFKKPGDGPATLHLHKQTAQAYLDQVTAEHYVYRRPKKKARGKWVWEPKSEGKANHYLDCLVGVFALADIKNCRHLASREVFEAMKSQPAGSSSADTRGTRMPDGRRFLSTQR